MNNFQNIAKYVNQFDFPKFKAEVHSLKGGISYCAGGLMFAICYNIQKAFEEENYSEMLNQYPQLLINGVWFWIEWRWVTSEAAGEKYEI